MSSGALHRGQTASLTSSSYTPFADRWQRDMQPTDFTSPLPPLLPYQPSSDVWAQPSRPCDGVETEHPPPVAAPAAAAGQFRQATDAGGERNNRPDVHTASPQPASESSIERFFHNHTGFDSNALLSEHVRAGLQNFPDEDRSSLQVGSNIDGGTIGTSFINDSSLSQISNFGSHDRLPELNQTKSKIASRHGSFIGAVNSASANADDEASGGARVLSSSTGLTGSTWTLDPAAAGSPREARVKPFDPARDLNPATPAPSVNATAIAPPPPLPPLLPTAATAAGKTVTTAAMSVGTSTTEASKIGTANSAPAIHHGDNDDGVAANRTVIGLNGVSAARHDRSSLQEIEMIPEAVCTTLPTKLYRPDPFPPVPPNRYQLEIIEHPRNARATTWGSKDRRMVTPPPILKLTLRDFDMSSEADHKLLTWPYNVIHATLWKCPYGSESDLSECYEATELNHMVNPNEGGLHGSLIASPFVLETPFAIPSYGAIPSEDRRETGQQRQQQFMGAGYSATMITTVPSCFFIFSDLSCHSRGIYRLRFELTHIDQSLLQAGGHSPTVAYAWSQPFEVYSAKEYPGVEPSSALLTYFKNHGALVTLRKGNDTRQRRKKRMRTSTVGGDFDSEDDEFDDY